MKEMTVTRVVSAALVFGMLMSTLAVQADDGKPDKQDIVFFSNFVSGQYQLLGLDLRSGRSYSGTVEIKFAGNALIAIVNTDGQIEERPVTITRPACCDTMTLLLEFPKQYMRGNFLVGSDLDNYPRLTGQIFNTRQQVMIGLEAWFPAK